MKYLTSFLILCLAIASQATTLNVNFEIGNTSSGDELSPADSAGVISSANWNNINVGNTGTHAVTIPSTVLNDNSGVATTATISSNLTSAYVGASGSGSSTKDRTMMSGYVSWDPADGTSPEDTGTITIANLPANFTAGYKVYVYFDSNANNRTFDVTVGGTTLSGADSATFSGTYLPGAATAPANANYALFTGLTSSSFTIAMNSNTGRAAINGIQIVSDDHIGPATIESFTADKTYVVAGSNVNFTWATSDATSLVLNPGNINLLPSSTVGDGSISMTINTGGTYTLTATNAGGTNTREVDIFVGPAKPNIVFFLVDDMGIQDTSVPFVLNGVGTPVNYNFNNFYQTPNMEALASDGMIFSTAYAQSVCSPTRTGLMTGRNSARHAVTDWVGSSGPGGSGSPSNWRSTGLDSTDLTLPKVLQTAGYRTIHIGKAHFGSNATGRDPLLLGFDVNIGGANFGHPGSYTGTYGQGGSRAVPHLEAYHNTGTYLTKALTLEANKAVTNAVDEGRPFFLNMSFYAVHAPFTTNPDATGDYSGSTGSNHTKFATMIEGMDIAVGEIRQKLVDLGVAKNTLIVFLGDNGSDSPAVTVNGLPSGSFSDFPMRGKKGSKWEGGSRVPFIACWADPDVTNSFQAATPIAGNSVETDIVSSWDIPVTFLSLAGIAKPAGFGEDGHDLLPYLRSEAGSHRPQEVVIHYPHNHRSDFFSFIREGDMKLIYNFQTDTHQLYDLDADPTESNDLSASDPSTTTRLSRVLSQRLNAMWGTSGPLRPTIATTAPAGNVVSIPNNMTVDVDGDGSVDTTEDPNRNGLIDAGETNPDDEDTDDDGVNDGDEAALGIDPLDDNSVFYLAISTVAGGDMHITWPSAPGSSFTIYSSTDLIDWTNVVATAVPGAAGNSTSYNVGNPAGPRVFYRVELE